MTSYIAEMWEKKIDNKIVSITNLTPGFSVDEKREVKQQIEAKLYDVFCKYVSVSLEGKGLLWYTIYVISSASFCEEGSEN